MEIVVSKKRAIKSNDSFLNCKKNERSIEDLHYRAEEIFDQLNTYSYFHGLNFFTAPKSKCVDNLAILM